jgi:3-oxoacyl-[acyl-carrier-protein] synthase-3
MPQAPRAHVLGIGSFMPNDPIDNERVEELLGRVGGKPSRVRHRIQKSSGITARHYAVDPETGRATHTNAQLTAQAIREMARSSAFDLARLEVLACGTSSPDQLIPNHALMVHGELGNPSCEVAATTGTCLSGITSLKYAAMSVASGQSRAAVATGSELSSSVMRATNFPRPEPGPEELDKNPLLAFGQDFLRWMLSDGAGAVLIGPREPERRGLSLAIDWIEIVSFASALPTCMYWGGEVREDGSFVGWRAAQSIEDAVQRGMMNLTQDPRLLGREITHATITRGFAAVRERHPIRPSEVDWLLPHYSSEFFRQPVYERFRELDFEIPFERWFTNLTTKGNTGSASLYVMLDELFHSGRLEPGQRILCYVPESARFSVGYVLLTVVG